MHYPLYLSAIKRNLNNLLIIFLVLAGFSANAQRRSHGGLQYGGGGGSGDSGYSITLSGFYDAPVGDLAYTYKGVPSFELSVLHDMGNFTFNATLGYHAYKPKLDTFFYDDGSGGYGSIHYQNFTVFAFFAGVAYNVPVSDQLKLYGGLNIGAYYTKYAFQSTDQFGGDSASFSEEDGYLAPKVGFTYLVSDNIGIGLEGKYNFFAPTGNSQDNPRVGTLYNSYAIGLVLTLKL